MYQCRVTLSYNVCNAVFAEKIVTFKKLRHENLRVFFCFDFEKETKTH